MNSKTISIRAALAVLLFGVHAEAAIIIDLDPPQFSGGVTTKDFIDAGLGVLNHSAYCSPSAAATLPDTAEFCATMVPTLTPQPSITATLKAYPMDFSGLTDNSTESTAG